MKRAVRAIVRTSAHFCRECAVSAADTSRRNVLVKNVLRAKECNDCGDVLRTLARDGNIPRLNVYSMQNFILNHIYCRFYTFGLCRLVCLIQYIYLIEDIFILYSWNCCDLFIYWDWICFVVSRLRIFVQNRSL